MAMSTVPCNEENQLGIKVRGDLGNFHIIEEDTESENDEGSTTSGSVDALSAIPKDVLKRSSVVPVCGSIRVTKSDNVQFGNNTYFHGSGSVDALSAIPKDVLKRSSVVPVCGSIRVTKSDNVQFGNNTYFHGPVTIKQVVSSKEQDNAGYEHTENEIPSGRVPNTAEAKKDDTQIQPIQLQLWLKLTFTAICVVIVGGVCAIVSVTLLYNSQEDTPTSNHDSEDSTKSVKVEGLFNYYHRNLKLTLVLLTLLLTYVWCYKLLTKETLSHARDKPSVKRTPVTIKSDKYNLQADPLLIAPTHLRIVSRTDWLAQPVEKPLDKIRLPVPWVIIQHTATESCYTQSECVLSVRLIQMFHVESRGWYDIGYNFLVAGDGSAYFGRGWEYEGAHTLGYNKYSMGIAFIGTFNNEPPPKKQLDACRKLIQKGVDLGKIAKDYKLFAHKQLASTRSPGDKLFDILKEWPHFVKNFTDIEELVPDY